MVLSLGQEIMALPALYSRIRELSTHLATWYWACDRRSWHCLASMAALARSYFILSPSTARNWKYLCDIPSSWTAYKGEL
jgi:hypothetical protein